MTATSSAVTPPLKRDERRLAIGAVGIGAASAIAIAATATSNLVRDLSGGLSFSAPFMGDEAELPIGPDGAGVAVRVQEATISAPETPLISVVSHIVAVAGGALAMLVVVACLTWLCLNISRARIFDRANERLLSACAAATGLGWLVSLLFGTMTINGAFASISDGDYDNVLAEVNFTPLIATFVFGVLAAAFRVGSRLQKETEGLV